MTGIMMNMMNNVVQASGPAYVTSGLQLYYNPLNYSGSGTSMPDLSGNGFNGTLVNSPGTGSYSSGYLTYTGGAINSVSSPYLQTPNMVSKFNSTSAVSIEMWVYATAAGMMLTENGATGSPQSGWTDAQMYFGPLFGSFTYAWTSIWNGTTVSSIAAGTANPAYNAWHQVVLTYNGTNVISYLNKTAGTTTAISRQTPWSIGYGYVLSIGAPTTTTFSGGSISNTYFTGRIGLVRAYNRALTSAEVTQNYNANKATYGL